MSNLNEIQKGIKAIIDDSLLTHEQKMMQLSKYADNLMPYPDGTPQDYYKLVEQQIICDLGEGHAPYTPRYILPDYAKLFREGCKFLRLDAPTNLYEAITTLLIFYRHVPSVTNFPVFLGRLDLLLEPFIQDEAEARMLLKGFLMQLDRTFGSSFCHANIGPYETKTGKIILELEQELQDAIPNLTLLYDTDITPDSFAQKCAETTLICANPAFANHKMMVADLGEDYGICSCYNGLPIGGGAFTLSRLRLSRIAEQATSVEQFFAETLPHAVDTLCAFMEGKIRFLVEETPFFRSNFLIKEGFIDIDRFVGLFGMVGLHECVNLLMDMQGKQGRYGTSEEANALGVQVITFIDERVKGFKSKYSKIWNHNFMMHAQVGAGGDHGITPGVRICIGQELPLYDHLRQAGLFHKFFPSGVGDIFPFDATASNNPAALVDIVKGAYSVGMRYISAYSSDSDVIRITGYLVKRSDLAEIEKGNAVSNDCVTLSQDTVKNRHTLDRKVRSV